MPDTAPTAPEADDGGPAMTPRDVPSPGRWRVLEPLLDAALTLPPERRAAFLEAASAGDVALRGELARMLAECERDEHQLDDRPAGERFAALVDDGDLPELRDALAGRYVIAREIGRGGMGAVYLARDVRHEREVALKVLAGRLGPGSAARRFLAEIRVTARLRHPHILPLYDSGEAAGRLYYVAPYVAGGTLRERLAREPRLPLADAVRALREVARALAHAHARGVVHRDVKPENVLLDETGAVLADFGIAAAVARAAGAAPAGGRTTAFTQVGVALGTPAYMAPEQAAGDPDVDHRADLYAWGVIAYELLAGAHPFAGKRSAQALIAAHLIEAPPPLAERHPALPPALADGVMRCLAKGPAGRPPSAGDLVDALAALDAPAAAAPRPAAPARPSLAVLPLVNLSGAPENEHFSDGLTDELIGALSQVAELAVSGRTSVFALKGKGLGVRAIADTLGVAHVLEGSVRRAGDRLKVRVQLVDVRGTVLWADAYDRMLTDVFAVQEEIARAVVGALEIRLGAGRGPLVRPPTADLAAYDVYLRGRYVRRRFNPDDLRRAIGYFEQAVARDPAYARAHAALSDTHTLLAVFAGRPALEVRPVARACARRAVELDPALADARWALAHVAFALELDLATAGREFQRALALDPGHVDARHMYAIWLLDHGRLDEAVAEVTQAIAADPLLAEARMTLGRVYTAMGQADRAVAPLLEALELAPWFTYAREQLTHAYLHCGRYDEALVEARRAAEGGGARESSVLAYACAVTGRREEAAAIVRQLTGEGERYVPPVHIAMAHAGLGDADAAFAALERAYVERDPHMTGLAILPAFRDLRSDARFASLLRRPGLASGTPARDTAPPSPGGGP